MKKHLIKLISIVLVLVLSILTMSSCGVVEYINGLFDSESQDVGGDKGGIDGNHKSHDLYPKGYTGGFTHQPGANIEYWWVETHEECLEAIELLKSHGSTFADEMVLTYDGELFDAKYCFVIAGIGAGTEVIKWGDNPFDRYAKNVRIESYAFFDNVTIDEINHSYVNRFNSYFFVASTTYSDLNNDVSLDNVKISEWTQKGNENSYKEGYYKFYKKAYLNDQEIIYISPCYDVKDEMQYELNMNDECINAIIFSGKIIELKDKE